MENLTFSGRNRAEYVNDNLINLSLFPADKRYLKGTLLKLDSADGKLKACLAADVPYGTVVVPTGKTQNHPTVITNFHTVAVALADADLVVGDLVKPTGWDEAKAIQKADKATSGNVFGIVVEAALAGEEARIGWFYTPIYKA